MGSNRTFMELKFKRERRGIFTIISSNRTFMELKCYCSNNIQQNFKSSNRTFMELKLESLSCSCLSFTEF